MNSSLSRDIKIATAKYNSMYIFCSAFWTQVYWKTSHGEQRNLGEFIFKRSQYAAHQQIIRILHGGVNQTYFQLLVSGKVRQ